ncbi:unnamed protein product [Ectocarpus sp. 12 AP-2014]
MTTSSSLGEYESSSSQAAEAAAPDAGMFALTCDTGFIFLGLQDAEPECTFVRVFCTLVTVSVVSAWFSRRKSIKMLLLFFSHWFSGLLYQLLILMQATMISVCWTGANLIKLIKTFKFLELASVNMLAMTNLAICINLALVVMSHGDQQPGVNSLSSPLLIMVSLVISIGAAAAAAPFWDFIILSGTGFFPETENQRGSDWITISRFYLEFFVGICMFVIVAWLLLFRMTEIKECWKTHARIRYYFGLTLIATGVNLILGICGVIYLIGDREEPQLIVVSWTLPHIHIALDTMALYGVLGAPPRYMDERHGVASSEAVVSVTHSQGRRTSSKPGSSSAALQSTSRVEKESSSNERVSFSNDSTRRNMHGGLDDTTPTTHLPSQWD